MSERDEHVFHVRVEIKPLWKRPPEGSAHRVERERTEMRFAMLADQVAKMIEARLEQMRQDQGENVHQWVVTFQLPGGGRHA